MLLRLPNLPSVPGDPLLGYLLAMSASGGAVGWPSALMVVLASLSLYACGLLLNDVADLREDQVARPTRPLPSGRVSPAAATIVACMLGGAGVGGAASVSFVCGAVALLLVAAVLIYTFFARRWPAVALCVMGGCRGLSVLLGAAVGGWAVLGAPLVMVAALTITAYTVALAAVALGETQQQRIGPKRYGPALVVLGGVLSAMLLVFTGQGMASIWLSLAWGVVLLVRAGSHGLRLRGCPPPALVGRTIGCFVRDIILLQAALCALVAPTPLVSLGIGSLWLVSWVLSRRFYGS